MNGLRYTGEDTIKVVDEVLHNDVNPRLVDAIVKLAMVAPAIGASSKYHW